MTSLSKCCFLSLLILTASKCMAANTWEIDLLPDPNTNSAPLASCVDEKTGRIIVVTKSGPRGSFLHKEGDCSLWEIGTDGQIMNRIRLSDKSGNGIRTSATAAGPGCAMAADSLGNLLVAGVFGEQKKDRFLTILSTTSGVPADPNRTLSLGDRIDGFSVVKILSCPDNSFILIGSQEENGIYLRIDNQGRIVRKQTFDIGKREFFSGAVYLPSSGNVVISGLSIGDVSKDSNIDNFVLIYDPNDKLIHEDTFIGDCPEMLISLPKICCQDMGHLIVVFYHKNKENNKAGLRARCYTHTLKLLWEKDLFSTDQIYFNFNLTPNRSNGFSVAVLSLKGVFFSSYDEKGSRIYGREYKGMTGFFGFNLIRVHDAVIAVFEEGGPGRIEDISIKTKAVRFE